LNTIASSPANPKLPIKSIDRTRSKSSLTC
jgi:hypothetical protein